MKIFRKRVVFVAAASMLVLSSCNKYIEEKSDKSLVVPSTVDDLLALLDDNDIMNSRTPGFGETSADDYFVRSEDFNGFGELDQRAYTWTMENYTFGNDWNFNYNAIFNSNFCLHKINRVERTTQNSQKWDMVKGSALFFRGYHFLLLCWDYAKAYDQASAATDRGIVLRLNSDFNIPAVRASVEQSYEQVLMDLREAADLLPLLPQHVMRPSKASAYGAMARTFLSMGKYDSAYQYANAALQIKSDLVDYNSGEVSVSSEVPFAPFNREIIFYTTQSGNYTPKSSPFALIDTTLYLSYDDNDLRKTAFFVSNNGFQNYKGSYAGGSYPFFSGITTAELLLTRAECNARSGKVSEAMDDINHILLNRWAAGFFTPVSAADASEALQIVLSERRKELVMRGLRWMDIKRLNKAGVGISLSRIIGGQTFILPPNDGKFALPIPSDVIELTGIPQN